MYNDLCRYNGIFVYVYMVTQNFIVRCIDVAL